MRARTLVALFVLALLGAAGTAIFVSCAMPAHGPAAAPEPSVNTQAGVGTGAPPETGAPQGRASILVADPTQIVVVQTPEVHASIEEFLQKLRKDRGLLTKPGKSPVPGHGTTGGAKGPATYELRIYDIGDLLVPSGGPSPSEPRTGAALNGKTQMDQVGDLLMLIKQSCGKGTWSSDLYGGVIQSSPPFTGSDGRKVAATASLAHGEQQ